MENRNNNGLFGGTFERPDVLMDRVFPRAKRYDFPGADGFGAPALPTAQADTGGGAQGMQMPEAPAIPTGARDKASGNMIITGMPAMPAARNMEAPVLFPDPDGVHRRAFNMGEGFIPADKQGNPLPMTPGEIGTAPAGSMMRKFPTSRGEAYAAVPVATPSAGPALPVGMGEGGTLNAQGGVPALPVGGSRPGWGSEGMQPIRKGYVGPEAAAGAARTAEMDRARRESMDATREARWNVKGGSTTERNRAASGALAALQARREADDQAARQIKVAQGTPQAAAGSGGVATYQPDQQGGGTWNTQMTPQVAASSAGMMGTDAAGKMHTFASPEKQRQWTEKMADLAPVIKTAFGANVDPNSVYALALVKDDAKRAEMSKLLTAQNPELAKYVMTMIKKISEEAGIGVGNSAVNPRTRWAGGGA